MKAGLGGYFSSKVLVLLETEKELTQKPILKAGIEYKPLDNFYLRMGVSNNPTLSTFGIGCMLKNLQLDLAVAYHQTLGVSPQIGFTYIAHKYKTNGLDTE